MGYVTFSASVKAAMIFGDREAICIDVLRYLILGNRQKGYNYHDGHWWTYNSVESWREWFPYWTTGILRHVLASLIDQGVLITGNYNKQGFDRTLWYAFSDEDVFLDWGDMDKWVQIHLHKITNGRKISKGLAQKGEPVCKNVKFHLQEREIPFVQMSEPIPITNTITNTVTNTITNTVKENRHSDSNESVAACTALTPHEGGEISLCPQKEKEKSCAKKERTEMMFRESGVFGLVTLNETEDAITDDTRLREKFGQQYANIDLSYYFLAILGWSDMNRKIKRTDVGWLQTFRQWIKSDNEKGKVHMLAINYARDDFNFL